MTSAQSEQTENSNGRRDCVVGWCGINYTEAVAGKYFSQLTIDKMTGFGARKSSKVDCNNWDCTTWPL